MGGLEGAGALNLSEDVMELQGQKHQWDVKVASLEEQLRIASEADDSERQRETAIKNEHAAGMKQNEEVQLQLQVVMEERDGLRDGMDLLWQEKTRLDEELEDVSAGYTNLTERIGDKMEEARELEEQLLQYENLLHMLQDNFDKVRHSPIPSETPEPKLADARNQSKEVAAASGAIPVASSPMPAPAPAPAPKPAPAPVSAPKAAPAAVPARAVVSSGNSAPQAGKHDDDDHYS